MQTRQARSTSVNTNAATQRRFGLLSLAVVMAAGVMLSGCNTTAGAGQDIKATGQSITRGADEVKSKL